MAHKELKYDVEARKALELGVDAVANAVKVTLGPRGRYVVLDKKFGAPTITNDGVTIAREIEVEDVFQNQGAQLVREVATATNDVAGDGTTTASGIVLPDTAKEKPQKGKVLAVGDGKLDDNGQRQPLDLVEGDEVLYSKYGGTEITVEGEDLLVLRESDVLAKVTG